MRAYAVVFVLAGLVALVGCVTEEQTKITPAKSGERTTVIGQTLDRADESACEQYAAQLQGQAQMYFQDNESYPPDIETLIKQAQLQSVTQDCKFAYDPATGRVSVVR